MWNSRENIKSDVRMYRVDNRPLSYYGLLLLQEKFFCSPMVD